MQFTLKGLFDELPITYGQLYNDYLFLFKLFLDNLNRSVQIKIFDLFSDLFSQLLLDLMFMKMVTESKRVCISNTS